MRTGKSYKTRPAIAVHPCTCGNGTCPTPHPPSSGQTRCDTRSRHCRRIYTACSCVTTTAVQEEDSDDDGRDIHHVSAEHLDLLQPQ